MIKFIEGGHWDQKGYYFCIYLNTPEFYSRKVKSIVGSDQSTRKVSFPTYFLLTTNNIYINIGISILGFGMGLEIQTKG